MCAVFGTSNYVSEHERVIAIDQVLRMTEPRIIEWLSRIIE